MIQEASYNSYKKRQTDKPPHQKKKKKNKQTNKKLIVCCGRFWLLHNQDWALDVLYTMIAHTPKESSASPKNNVLVNKLNNMITT